MALDRSSPAAANKAVMPMVKTNARIAITINAVIGPDPRSAASAVPVPTRIMAVSCLDRWRGVERAKPGGASY